MTSELEMQGKNLTVHPCTEQMDNFLSEFHKHFQDSAVLEPVAAFMCCLFQEDAEVVAHITNGKKNFFTWTLLEWKMRVWHHKPTFSWSPGANRQFWISLTLTKMKCATSFDCIICLHLFMWVSQFPHMKIIKSKYCSTMTDDHFDAVNSYCQQLLSGLCIPGWFQSVKVIRVK